MVEKIDAHHHLWHYRPEEYRWIDYRMAVLKHDFLPNDLEKELATTGTTGTVVVQARQTLEETSWLLDLAAKSKSIRGVVGWAPIASEGFAAELERLQSRPKLKGLRHVIQDEPYDNYILDEEFNEGISRLKDTGLVYDILIFEKHLPATIQFVDRHPHQIFVLNHLGKPKIRDRVMDPWRHHIDQLARRPNVYCKISGMVTEADWSSWSKDASGLILKRCSKHSVLSASWQGRTGRSACLQRHTAIGRRCWMDSWKSFHRRKETRSWG